MGVFIQGCSAGLLSSECARRTVYEETANEQQLFLILFRIAISQGTTRVKLVRFRHAHEGQDRAVHCRLDAKVLTILDFLLAIGIVVVAVMGRSERWYWVIWFALSGRWVSASPASSTSVSAFLVGASVSWAGTSLQQWWNGPTCYSVSAAQFANLRSCNDCGHELEHSTSTTTTELAKQAAFIGWDFWWWIRAAMFCGACLALGLCWAGFYLLRCYFGSNGVGMQPRVDTGMDVVNQRADHTLAVLASSPSPLVLPFSVAAKEETARAQVAFIRSRQASLPVAE